MAETLEVSENATISQIGKALSSPTRLKILQLLLKEELDVTCIARALRMTDANASAQVKILLDSGLLECRYEPGMHGLKKLCRNHVDSGSHIIHHLELVVSRTG
ncbi:MAG: ArsR/SmtB family transcription factor [Candidatus Thorarchaeota archaeon]